MNNNSHLPGFHSVDVKLDDGRTLTIETGKLAKQAHGSAVIKLGDTMLLASVVSSKEIREGQDFFPLSVDYQEKFGAGGKIPGNFHKREGRLSDHEILISRLVDRALRPLFPDGYLYDTQVLIYLISSDKDVQPDALAGLAASAALSVSDIPFAGPISEVRVARVNGEYKVNPNVSDMENADLDIIMAATHENIMMVEGEMSEVQEEDLVKALQVGHDAIKKQCEAQMELAKKVGATEKRSLDLPVDNEEMKSKVAAFAKDKIHKVAAGSLSKDDRSQQFAEIRKEWVESFGDDADTELIGEAKVYFDKLKKEVIRTMMLDEQKRLDGRKMDEIRPIWIETDYLPKAHGSAIFTRGETQSLTTVTYGNKSDEMMIDQVNKKDFKKFFLHYNFPAFSVGESRPNRGPGRREVGHGNLAERSLKQVLPSADENPYTIRIVSDILESNGSSSMATVCAGSLAMMDAGVKISGHVSGIAMGLVGDAQGKTAILSDILGDEDHLGDMDFKVTGTRKGICACQMDIKIEGLSYELLTKALHQAREGRMHILDKMEEAISAPRAELKPHIPRIEKIFIPSEFIGAVIGPGGKIIQEIQKETGTEIFLEEVDDKGVIQISGDNKEAIDNAVNWIKRITAVPEKGETYEGTVKSIMPYGAFVEILPGREGLLHISEISWKRLPNMEGIFTEGDKVKVKLMDIDERSGKLRLSRKVLLEDPEEKLN